MSSVRRGEPADAPALAGMLHDFNLEFGDPSPGVDVLRERVAEFISGGVKQYLIALATPGEPTGFAQVDFIRSIWSQGPIAHLDELYVVPRRRGEGFGRALMETMLALAHERGAAGAEVVTGEDDAAARALYEGFGFANATEGVENARSLFYELEFE